MSCPSRDRKPLAFFTPLPSSLPSMHFEHGFEPSDLVLELAQPLPLPPQPSALPSPSLPSPSVLPLPQHTSSMALSLAISSWNSRSIASLGSSLMRGLFLMFLARLAYLGVCVGGRDSMCGLYLALLELELELKWECEAEAQL